MLPSLIFICAGTAIGCYLVFLALSAAASDLAIWFLVGGVVASLGVLASGLAFLWVGLRGRD